MPKVSVIVPVHNTEKYLPKCLDSLVNQTLQDIKIIIVNDGSTDNSQKIINEFYNKYPNKIIRIKKENGGLSSARNLGMEYADGEYLGFVDSDDYVSNSMFEDLYNSAIKSDADLVECNFAWIFPKKIKEDRATLYITKQESFVVGRVMACNKLFKTQIIKKNDIKFPLNLKYEDIEFFYKVIPYINKFQFVSKILYYYVQRDNSIVNSQNEKNGDVFEILNNILNYYKKNNLFEIYKTELEYMYIKILFGSSLKRISKIRNKEVRDKLLNKTLKESDLNFPEWKNNKILLNNKTLKELYYKTINKFTFKIYSVIFKIL